MAWCRAKGPYCSSDAENRRTWKWLLSRPSNGLLNFRAGFVLEALRDFMLKPGSQLGKRFILPVVFDLFRGAHVITLGMMAQAVGMDDLQVRPLFLPNLAYYRSEMVVEFFGVGGFNLTAVNAKGPPSSQHASSQLLLNRRAL